MGGVPLSVRQDLYLRLHCVNIYVRDQDRSLRFYLDRLPSLGFLIAEPLGDPDRRGH